jgi:cytochrome c-type biogenesis protein CcmH
MDSALLFALITVTLVAIALAFVLPPLLRTRLRAQEAARDEIDDELFRRELDELQQEAELGELPPDEAAAERARARERWLASRERPAEVPPRRHRTRLIALLVACALPLIAIALYLAVGQPGALAPSAEVGSAGDYVARLQTHLARQPRDARGWVLLARALAERNDFAAAAAAYDKAIAASPKVAKDPGVLCELADALGMAQGGRLDGRPAELVAQALAIDPQHPVALEMAGSVAYADGRYADAVRSWQALRAQLPPASAQHAELSAAIERAQRRAAVALPR